MHKGVILSVDDDHNLQVVIADYLESDGYKVLTANDFKSALEAVNDAAIDVILLDLVLPDGEGLSLIAQFQLKTRAPVIVVSGKSDTTEKIVCLEMGADDYLTKPFEMRELSARIKAVMRRMNAPPLNAPSLDKDNDEAVNIAFNGGWVLDRAQYQIFDPGGCPVDLTTGEFKLAAVLIEAPQRAMSRERLFALTREDDYDGYDRAIDIQIARVRKKLNDNDATLIKTVRGVGYMFTGQHD